MYQSEGVTDQVLFGDCRPVHQIAVQQARSAGIRNHVFEEGYFRPYWVTLEREGVNSRSSLPKDSEWFRRAGYHLTGSSTQIKKAQFCESPFWHRAVHDVAYHLSSALNPLFFSRYCTHAPVLAPVEYSGFVTRVIKNKFNSAQNRIKFDALFSQSNGFYFVPLQLNSDFQVRGQSVHFNMTLFIEHIIASFSRFAPVNTKLVIKNHPLDFGQIDYQLLIDKLAIQYYVTGRIVYFETGHLPTLLHRALGTVTLNSTVGIVSLEAGCPTLCLSEAIYNLPALTAQCSLDNFWEQIPKPDSELFHLFKTVVMHTTQVNGGFYSPPSIALATQASADRLTTDTSPLEQLMQQIVP
jgi:capsular polysaccharide export protein